MELIGDLLDFHNFMAIERHCSPRTAFEYCRDIDRFSRSIAPVALNTIDTPPIRRWLVGLMANGSNKPQSVHRKIAALTAYFKWVKREGYRNDNPVEQIERPKCDKRLPTFLSREEVEQVINAFVPRRSHLLTLRDKAMLCTMYGSGLRRAEVCGLSLCDVDLDRRVARVFGKGAKERVVFLAGVAITALKAYLNARGPCGVDDPLFVTQRRDRITCRQLWCVFRDHRKASGLKKHFTPHTFRHSFASHMIQNGADIVTVKELLGHSNIATTNTYAHVSLEHMRAAFEKAHPHALVETSRQEESGPVLADAAGDDRPARFRARLLGGVRVRRGAALELVG